MTQAKTWAEGRHLMALGKHIAPARFVAFLALLPVGYFGYRWLTGAREWMDCAAVAFDFASLCFLASLVPLLRDSRVDDIRRHARNNDANRVLVLLATLLLAFVAMAAVTGELPQVRQGSWIATGKLAGTLLLVWTFANTMYALHYAHAFYASRKGGKDVGMGDGADDGVGDAGGIDFPNEPTPSYYDFAYFAFTIGMTFQTSDVAITASAIRRITLLHSFFAYIFSIGVIAFTINVLGGN